MTTAPVYPQEDIMEDPYSICICAICRHHICRRYMEEREDGLYCDRCAVLPAYSHQLYNALVSFQRLFRAHFAAKAVPCGACNKLCLKRHDYFTDRPAICTDCLNDNLDAERAERECPCCYEEQCRCDDGSEWCEKCESPFGNCICAEIAYEEERKRVHYCGDPTCEWNCGILVCGCIDVCRNYDCRDY